MPDAPLSDPHELLERTAQIAAHRVCGGCEHDPANGKFHGFCMVCLIPWPCEYAGTPPVILTDRDKRIAELDAEVLGHRRGTANLMTERDAAREAMATFKRERDEARETLREAAREAMAEIKGQYSCNHPPDDGSDDPCDGDDCKRCWFVHWESRILALLSAPPAQPPNGERR